jgi:2-dehydropantoate 2-reductase
MRVAVFGSGGVGGYFGGRLARSGVSVAFLARGEHLRALRRGGLRVESVLGDFTIRPLEVTDEPSAIGPVDFVLLAVKTWQLPSESELRPLLGEHTAVVTLQNGVEAPEQLARLIGAERVLPGTVRIFSEVAAPGVIRHSGGPASIAFAERDDASSERVERLREAFRVPGVVVDVPADIHAEIWRKFLFVVPMGSVGAVTRAPVGVTRSMPETRELLERAMHEVHEVATAHDIRLPPDVVRRTLEFLDLQPPGGTSSMQRDIASDRPSELDAWTGAVVRLASRAGVAVPIHDLIYRSLLPLERRARGEADFS